MTSYKDDEYLKTRKHLILAYDSIRIIFNLQRKVIRCFGSLITNDIDEIFFCV